MDKFVNDLLTEDILKEVSKRYDVKRENLYFVGGFENYIYGFDRGEKSYVVRISHSSHRTIDEIKSELDFVFYLAKNGASVSMPIETISKQLVESIDAKDGSYFIISAFDKAQDRRAKIEDFSPEFFQAYGKVIGKFHKLTKSYVPSEGIKERFVWYEDQVLVEAKKYLKEEDMRMIDILKELMDDIKKIPVTNDNFGLIHTDVHMGNFFITEDHKFTVFDFDDASYQYFISDIAIVLYYLTWFTDPESDRLKYANFFMANFMDGYNTENKLSKEDFLTIDKFLKLREILIYIVIHKTVELDSDFARRYIPRYRERILNNVPYIDLDFTKYL